MEDLILAVKPHYNTRSFKKRSVILYQGEIPRYANIITKGVVKVYSLSANGEEQVIRILSKDDVFSIPWLFEKTNHALYYYEAQTDCTVVCIEKKMFSDTVSNNPKLQAKLIDYLATLHTSSMIHITALEQARAREKILNILYYLCLLSGSEFKPGKYKVELHLTHGIIASLSGLTRETTALELSKLKKTRTVKYTARYYLIDKLKIEQLLGEDNFANLSLNK